MQRITIVTAFEGSQDPFFEITQSYMKRTYGVYKPALKELKPTKLLEGTEGCYRIVLDERGAQLGSEEFAAKIRSLIDQSHVLAFMIGAADGHPPEVKDKANLLFSLSKMTLPHRMALCMLAEQIYRAGEIIRGGPYHRA